MPKQSNFSGGEISPLLHGRTDLPVFATGVRKAENFFISKEGAAFSRPGTTYVAPTAFPGPPPPLGFTELNYGKPRLIPFVASDDTGYVLEFGTQIIRFFKRGAILESPPGTAYAITTYTKANGAIAPFPYTWSYLSLIRYSQVGDSLILCHPAFPAIELRRNGDVNWSAREIDFARPAPQYADVNNPNQVTTPYAFVTSVARTHGTVADGSHPAREWQWMVTALVQDPDTGEKYETIGDRVSETWDGISYDTTLHPLTDDNAAVYSDRAVTLRRGETAALLQPVERNVIAYNFYRGRGQLFGFLGTTTTREFVDTGDEPDYAKQPPRATNPFEVKDALGNLLRTEHPAAVTHFQARRVFGGTFDDNAVPRQTETLFLSATEDFFDFDLALLIDEPGESLVYTLAGDRRESVRHVLRFAKKLMAGTGSSWWSGDGGESQRIIDFDHVDIHTVDEVGTGYARPCIVEQTLLFARTKGSGLRGLVPTGDEFQAFDASDFAQHLFMGAQKGIVDMAYAEDPWGTLWVVREDGVLLSLTYVKERMMAWTHHAFGTEDDPVVIEAVCSVPEGDEDAVYLAVKRVIEGQEARYIERMTSRHARGGAVVDAAGALTTPPDYICVDAALKYVGPAVTVFTGMAHLNGKQVYVVAQGSPVLGPFPVVNGNVDMGAQLATNVDTDAGPVLVAYVGLGYVCDLELLDIAGGEARLRQKQVTHVGLEVNDSKGLLIGQDFDHLTAVPSRAVVDAFNSSPLKTQVVLAPVKGHSDLGARACVRQALPLPCTVVGFSRKLASGDEP